MEIYDRKTPIEEIKKRIIIREIAACKGRIVNTLVGTIILALIIYFLGLNWFTGIWSVWQFINIKEAIGCKLRINYINKNIADKEGIIVKSKGYFLTHSNGFKSFVPYIDMWNRGFFLNNSDFVQIFENDSQVLNSY